MKIYPFKALSPNIELIASPESFFDNVKTEFRNYKENGFYIGANDEAFYLYSIEKNGAVYSGIIADTDIEEMISNKKILKHEQTLVSKEQTMMHLILHRQAMVKPVLLSFPKVDEIENLMEELHKLDFPEKRIKFKSNGETHIFKKIAQKQHVNHIKKVFDQHLGKTYIADGHHRASTMTILYGNNKVPDARKKFNRLLCAYFPFSELTIESYNRVIDLMDTITPTKLIAELSNYCKIELLDEAQRPESNHQMTMFLNQEWYSLKWKSKVLKSYKQENVLLDSALFNSIILGSILGIEDVRFDTRITYISGAKGTKGVIKTVNEKPIQAGFFLPSVTSKEIVSIVDRGKTLPPKSTWFLPRLRSGIIVKEFES